VRALVWFSLGMACTYAVVVARQAWSESETEMSETERSTSCSTLCCSYWLGLVLTDLNMYKCTNLGAVIVKQYEVSVRRQIHVSLVSCCHRALFRDLRSCRTYGRPSCAGIRMRIVWRARRAPPCYCAYVEHYGSRPQLIRCTWSA
jgi:hypothetical protein